MSLLSFLLFAGDGERSKMQYKYLPSAMDHLDSIGSSPVISQWKGKDLFSQKEKIS